MKVLNYVNRFSRGISRVQRELKENGNGEAEFDFSLITAFKVIEHISTKYFEAGFGSEEVETTHKANSTTQNSENATQRLGSTTQSTTQNEDLTTQKIILEALRNNPTITREELVEMLPFGENGVKYHLQTMRKNGIIKHEGTKRGGKWIILK
ncbi:MAG: winged helix-turn-helix transcriptional regulator [Mediterranea sp.]|jgi:ATP-dependent DNA helicase RecG|nr:winged helix-turn-helix transcriptional regulator [Mediterranea sp.]